MGVTQKEIAEKLNISQSLVARALKGEECVAPSTRERILKEADALGYRPNPLARALLTGCTYQIALCFSVLGGGSFYEELIRQFGILARHSPFSLLITTFNPQRPGERSPHLSVDGMVFVGQVSDLPHTLPYPVVTLQHQVQRPTVPGEEKFDWVHFVTQDAASAAVEHLVQQNHRRIAYVTVDGMITPQDVRYSAYHEVMQKAGLTPEVIALPMPDETRLRDQAYDFLKTYFQENDFPEAIFCSNDDIAVGAYRALHELGRPIPEGTAVVGYDDLGDALYLNPPLTSVHLPVQEACRHLWQMLMQRIQNNSLPPQHELLKARLIVRDSSSGKMLTAEDEKILLGKEN